MDLKVVLIIESKVVPCQNLFDQFHEVFCRLLETWESRACLHTSMPSLCGPSLCGRFVYSDVTSRVTKRVSSGRLFGKDCSFNKKSVVSLRWEGKVSTCGYKWWSTNLEIFSVGAPHEDTIGRSGLRVCDSWVASRIMLLSHGVV